MGREYNHDPKIFTIKLVSNGFVITVYTPNEDVSEVHVFGFDDIGYAISNRENQNGVDTLLGFVWSFCNRFIEAKKKLSRETVQTEFPEKTK